MDKKKFNTAHRRAKKAENEMVTQCGIMAGILQDFFDEEIEVLFQPGDGFVVLHGMMENTPVDDVIIAIQKDVDAFR